jgi:hypothetical protein
LFGDPISISKNGVASSLPRIAVGTNSGSFQTPDKSKRVDISHQYGKRIRRQLRYTENKIASDPLTADNLSVSSSAYIVLDTPLWGFSIADNQMTIDSLLAFLSTNSDAAITKLLGGEA